MLSAAGNGDGENLGAGDPTVRECSQRNWGIGDIEDLRALAGIAERAGAGGIGINPLHALHPSNPRASSRTLHPAGSFSTRSTSTRRPFPNSRLTTRQPPRSSNRLGRPLIDCGRIGRLKWRAFLRLHRSFRRDHLKAGTPRGAAFARFIKERASRSSFSRATRRWPNIFSRSTAFTAGSSGRSNIARRNRRQYDVRSRARGRSRVLRIRAVARAPQLGAAAAACAAMACGSTAILRSASNSTAPMLGRITHDLGDASLGAPPDPLNALGQNWGLPPLRRTPCANATTSHSPGCFAPTCSTRARCASIT